MNKTVLASFMILCLLSTAILTKFKSGNCVLTDNEGTGFREIKPESYTCEGDLGQLTTNCSNAFDSDWSTKLEWDKSCTSGDFVIVLIENYSLPTSLTYVNWEFKAYHNNTGSLMPSPMTIHCWNGSSWKMVYVLDDTDHVNEVFAERITMPPEAFVKGRLSIMTSIKYSSHWVMTGPLWHYVEYFEGKPNLIIVDDDNIAGPWDGTAEHPYKNITSGLEHASANDTVFVHAGTYYEHVTIDKSISVIGENRNTTVIDGSGAGTVVSVRANETIIRGFTIQNGTHGIDIAGVLTHGNVVEDNIVADMNGDGIMLRQPYNNTIIDNEVLHIGAYGVCIMYATNNLIINNTVTSTLYGLYVEGWYSNVMRHNRISNNEYGISLDSSNRNIITENTIANNGIGIELYGDDNIIFHNNFINNSEQVITQSYLWRNIIDDGYPSGGNYWSSYIGTDARSGVLQNETGSDGIRDTEFIIDSNNIDHYPLMGIFSDFNATSDHHVQTICNSSISDLVFNGTAISFDVFGENGTAGFCRICIPIALMNGTYRVFVNGTEILPSPLPLPCSNNTHTYLYFTYNHSTKEVIIVPEFPSLIILPLFMIATLLAVIVYRRKHLTRAR